MADLLEGFALYLTEQGLLTYTPDDDTGDTFLEEMPASPDEAVALTLYGTGVPDAKLGYDARGLQVRVRGTSDPTVSHDRAEALFNVLQGLGPITLPDGSRLLSCFAVQAVSSMGMDESRRFEHVVNFALELRNQTAHRE